MEVYVITKKTYYNNGDITVNVLKVVSSTKRAEEVKKELEKELKTSKNKFLTTYPKGLNECVTNMSLKEYTDYCNAREKSGLDSGSIYFYSTEYELE